MGDLLTVAQSWFREEGWSFTVVQPGKVLRLSFDGKRGTWPCIAEERADSVFVFYSICAEGVRPEVMPAVSELTARINASLAVGNFELDHERAAVRFRTSVDVAGGALTRELAKNVSLANVATVERFRPALLEVLKGGDVQGAFAAALAQR